jgi:hypothetical protein
MKLGEAKSFLELVQALEGRSYKNNFHLFFDPA